MSFRHVFQTYLDDPSTCTDITLYKDENVLIIKDLFPKSLRHYLVLPRSPKFTKQHPLDAFKKDEKFYDIIGDYVEKAKQLIVDSLVEHQLIPNDHLKIQEFKNTFIQTGIHSIPSLSNLHIHVMTKDFHSDRMKNRKHYNSFNTSFFVEYDDLDPTEQTNDYNSDQGSAYSTDDEQMGNSHERDTGVLENIIKKSPLVCRYCFQDFGNSFSKLKAHLDEEFNKQFDNTKNCKPNA